MFSERGGEEPNNSIRLDQFTRLLDVLLRRNRLTTKDVLSLEFMKEVKMDLVKRVIAMGSSKSNRITNIKYFLSDTASFNLTFIERRIIKKALSLKDSELIDRVDRIFKTKL